MIITDDVYGTFVPHFRSLMYELPYNTACVYSFSKYFGATGWRLATIAIARHNVFDAQIALLPENNEKNYTTDTIVSTSIPTRFYLSIDWSPTAGW